MKKVIVSMLAVAGMAMAANAAETTIVYEASVDGGNTWASSVNAAPGSEVQVRARVVWSGTAQVFGLSQVIFQPVVSNWTGADSLETTPGTPGNNGIGPVGGTRSTPIGTVPDAPGVFGRITPFGANAYSTSTYLRGHVGTGTAAGLLRLSRADVTNWIGVGPTSGAAAVNNWTGAAGVSIAQIAPASRLPTDPAFNDSSSPIVFKFGFVLGSSTDARTLSINTPIEGINRETAAGNANYGHAFASWFLSSTAAQGTRFYDSVGAEGASITVTPAPGALALIGLGGLVATRRRR